MCPRLNCISLQGYPPHGIARTGRAEDGWLAASVFVVLSFERATEVRVGRTTLCHPPSEQAHDQAGRYVDTYVHCLLLLRRKNDDRARAHQCVVVGGQWLLRRPSFTDALSRLHHHAVAIGALVARPRIDVKHIGHYQLARTNGLTVVEHSLPFTPSSSWLGQDSNLQPGSCELLALPLSYPAIN